MKRLIYTAALLTIAALMATVVSCSDDNNLLTEQPAQPDAALQTVHVTVGAGFSDGAPSRSAVVTAGGKRTLTFTEGDRLYVYARINNSYNEIMAGYLDMVGTPTAGATTATFGGDLSIYKRNNPSDEYEVSSHTFTTEDPLGECYMVIGSLVHKDANGFVVDEDGFYGEYESSIAPTVDELMTTMLPVNGDYDSNAKGFTLSVDLWGESSDEYCAPIFNCTISGLKPGTVYDVSHIYSSTIEGTIDGHGNFMGSVTADADGKATFAGYNVCKQAENYHVLNFIAEDYSDERNAYLGKKALSSKVYNITRPAVKFQPAEFSVDDTKKVYFSKGNLYAHKGSSGWSWRFQPYQWGYEGDDSGNTLITGPLTTSENNVSVDLFCWNGESSPYNSYGIDSAGNDNMSQYGNVADESLKNDWGVPANAARLSGHNNWRTLTASEWLYLLKERTVQNSWQSGARYTMATLGGIYKGLILFPDNYTHPAGTGLSGDFANAATSYTSTVSLEGWLMMENAGCIFLPAAGSRYQQQVWLTAPVGGYYWSSTSTSSNAATNIRFTPSNVGDISSTRTSGYSVRLVRDAE